MLKQALVPSLFVATAFTATSVGVSVEVWREKRTLNSRNGELLVDVAELDDITGVILMAILFALLGRTSDVKDPGVRRLDLWLAVLFALASLRSALWAAGLDVYLATMVILAVAAVGGGWIWIRTRRTARTG